MKYLANELTQHIFSHIYEIFSETLKHQNNVTQVSQSER